MGTVRSSCEASTRIRPAQISTGRMMRRGRSGGRMPAASASCPPGKSGRSAAPAARPSSCRRTGSAPQRCLPTVRPWRPGGPSDSVHTLQRLAGLAAQRRTPRVHARAFQGQDPGIRRTICTSPLTAGSCCWRTRPTRETAPSGCCRFPTAAANRIGSFRRYPGSVRSSSRRNSPGCRTASGP